MSDLPPRIFFDSSVLIAGSISNSGASYALGALVEMGLITAVSCPYVIEEVTRNLALKAASSAENRFDRLRLAIVTPRELIQELRQFLAQNFR